MPKAVFSDVDWTLIASMDPRARAGQGAVNDFGHGIAFKGIRNQIGKCDDQLMPGFLSKEELDLKDERLEKHCGQDLKDRYLRQVTPFPGLRVVLQRLQADSIRIALASSARRTSCKPTSW